MPRASVWFIRAALLYLAVGFTFGALLLANKGLHLHPHLWRLLPAHIEFLLVGWTVQLVLGMAFWILPRFQTSRGNVKVVWLAFWLLNAGILLAGLGPSLGHPQPYLLLGRLAEMLAILAFALNAWPRVKPVGA